MADLKLGTAVGGFLVLHTGNFNTYAPKLDGSGAFGVWDVSITGSAGSAIKLLTSRTIAISTGATGTATSFDGTSNITIPITSLAASYLSGTIPSGVLGNSTVYIGTTAIALNRASASISLTGTSIDGNAGTATVLQTSRTIAISTGVTGTATSFNGSANIIIPVTSVDASYLSGTIPSGVLGNSTVYIGTTAVLLNRASASQTLTGISVDGNAGTATTLQNARTIAISTGATGTATSFNGSANITIPITSLAASYLSGTIPSSVLGSSTVYIGTTAIALNRTSASQTLTGISVDGNAGTATTLQNSRTIAISTGATGTATSFNGSANITIPVTSLAASYLSGTIPSGVLGNSTVYIGTTAVLLNRASASISLTGTSIDGNAGTATTLQNSRTIAISTGATGTATSFNGSANITIPITSLAASYLSGTIPSSVLGNSSMYMGTTSVALNRASASLTLSGITLNLGSNPGSTQTYIGIIETGTVGESVVFGDVLYLNFSDGKWWKAKADAYSTTPGMRMALATISASASGNLLVCGNVRYDSWSFASSRVFLSEATAGAPTSTEPSTTGNQIQVLGIAKTSNTMYFNPSMDVGEI